MTNLQHFQFTDNDIRVVTIKGEPWFVAKDVCQVLGISKYRDALTRLDKDERGSVKLDTPGGKQGMATISESGLYALVLSSRKPEARPFQRWVTKEVLPSIRKTGSYSLNRDTNWQLTRQSGKYNRSQFTDAIKFYLDNHPERSERYAKFVYSNATNQQYREVFGLPAKKLKELLGVPRTGLLRDYFPIEELGTIITIEAVACTLVFDHEREPVTAIKEAIERTLCAEKHLEKYKDLKTLP